MFQHQQLVTSGRIPEPDAAIMAGRGQAPARSIEGKARDKIAMPEQPMPQGTCMDVPQADGSIGATRCQSVAIRTECQTTDGVRVAVQVFHLSPVRGLPNS